MNSTIKLLEEQLKEQEDKLKALTQAVNIAEKALKEEQRREERILNKVLQNHIVDIVGMIERHGLKCVRFNSTGNSWGQAIYRVSDDFYDAEITVENGTIEMVPCVRENDGSGSRLYRSVETLIKHDIIPFCEKNKEKYAE